eukprot:m.232024 g.232024  ORF g.232024 m.232024 type:complete len:450 (-) comp33613_c0_seq7:3667-5016(-)
MTKSSGVIVGVVAAICCAQSSNALPYMNAVANPADAVTWKLGWQGQACDQVCESQNMWCSEHEWPASQDEFNKIASSVGARCSSVISGSYDTNPQLGSDQNGQTNCWWEDDQPGDNRCAAVPENEEHQRFCPCAVSKPKPTPAKAQWELGYLGQSCEQVCSSQSMWCTETSWPNTADEFTAILKEIPNAGCTSIDGGWSDMETNPEKQDGQCWWAATKDSGRCTLVPPSDHQRFCPCTKTKPPPPPPQWKVGYLGQDCNKVCNSQNLYCHEGHWPTSAMEFATILTDTSTTCRSTSPGWSDMGANPEMDESYNCWWSGGTNNRCGILPPSDHHRFCPCSTSPPAPTWMIAYAGQNCTRACDSVGRKCTESVWPTSDMEFTTILNKIPNNGCASSSAGWSDMEANPEKQGDQCWWSSTSMQRCDATPPSDHERFCPCVPRAADSSVVSVV